jgi:hypothetical protein
VNLHRTHTDFLASAPHGENRREEALVMWSGCVIAALVVVAFWSVPIVATLVLFPTAPPKDRRANTCGGMMATDD